MNRIISSGFGSQQLLKSVKWHSKFDHWQCCVNFSEAGKTLLSLQVDSISSKVDVLFSATSRSVG